MEGRNVPSQTQRATSSTEKPGDTSYSQLDSDDSNDSYESDLDDTLDSTGKVNSSGIALQVKIHRTNEHHSPFNVSGSQPSPSSSLAASSSCTTATDHRDHTKMNKSGGEHSLDQSFGSGDNGKKALVKRKRRPRPQTGLKMDCAVCGDEAFGYNFDAVSCESCKAFFRRNAMRQHVCQNGNQCKIDKDSRKYCSSCRLTKCLDVGMKRELILTAEKLEKRAKLVRKKHLHQPADESTSTSALTSTSTSTPIGGATSAMATASKLSATGTKLESKFSSPPGRGAATSGGEGEYSGSKGERRSGGLSSGRVTGVYDVSETESAAKQKRGGSGMGIGMGLSMGIGIRTGHEVEQSSHSAFTNRLRSPDSVSEAATLAYAQAVLGSSGVRALGASPPEVVLSEMSRLGIGMNIAAAAAAAAAAASRSSGSGDAVPTSASYAYAEHFRDMYHQQPTPPQAIQVKHEHQDSPSPSSAFSIVPSSESCVKLVAKLSQATIEYDEMLAKCGSACGQLLRPLNFSDMKQMRPANDASEQFNYGEVFVRRFVNVFKQIDEFRGLGQVAQLKLLRSAMVSTLNIAGVFSFDASRQAWVLQAEGCEERVYLIGDMVALFESSGQTHIRDYMRSYCEFHTRLRNELGSDVVLFFVLILIDLFSPHRFTTDRSMLSLLVPAHARYVQFLEMYLAKNYASVGVSGKPRIPEIGGRDSAFGRVGGGSGGSGIGLGSSVLPSEDEAVKQKLDFCLDMLLQARTLEEYLAVTSQFIGLSAMVPLLAEVCEQQLNEGY